MMLWLRNNFVLFDFRYCLEDCFTCDFDCFGDESFGILRFFRWLAHQGVQLTLEMLTGSYARCD